jgi:DeoR/GlpR family transcriptional regulator of sugar metabolism
MIVKERERLILDYLDKYKIATIFTIIELTGASIATVRRDINALNEQGLLKKIRGGVESMGAAEPRSNRMFLADGMDPYFAEKDQVARLAVKMVETGDTIFLGAGKTCALLARYIDKPVTVVTTSINVVIELTENEKVSILLLGGIINKGMNYMETLDEFTIKSLENYYFDKVFITPDGIDISYGYTIINRLQIPLYNYLQENCKNFYLLTISSKYNRRTFSYLGDINKFDRIVVTPQVDKKYLEYYNSQGIRLFLTKEPVRDEALRPQIKRSARSCW